MIPVVEIACAVILIILVYKWRKNVKLKERMEWLPAIPHWPILGNVLEFGDSTEILQDLARLISKYGKLIRGDMLVQPIILATDYDFVEFVLGNQTILNKSQDYDYMLGWVGTGLFTSDGPKWKKRRKMITPAFHFSLLEQFISHFEPNGEILIEQLKKELDKDCMDVYPYMNRFTLDVICETAMGVSLHAQTNKDSKYGANIKELCRIITDRSFSLFKRNNFLYKFSRDYYKELVLLRELHSITYSVIDDRKRKLETKKKQDVAQEHDGLGLKQKMAFLDILLQSTVDGKSLSREDVREEVDTFMFAGYDTTASALSFTIFVLSKHPDVQKRCFEEQKEIFHEDLYRGATYKDLQKMKYLELVINENLRLYPPVPIIARKTNVDTEYKGNIIPKDLNITIFIYGMLRDPDNFRSPEKFDPNRPELGDNSKPYSHVAFSAGPRNCIGQKFAMLELKSTLSKLLRHFNLLPTIPQHEPILAAEVVLKSKNGIKIKLANRVL